MKTNKKSQLMIIGAVLIGLLVIGIILFSTNVLGGKMDSLTPIKEGCKSPSMDIRIKGNANVKDSAFFGVIAEAESIDVSEVRSVTTGESYLSLGNQLRGFTSDDYNWKVDLLNTRTGNSEADDKGSNTHTGSSLIQNNAYILDFSIPDNDCNGKIDDFDGKLKLTVTTEDNKVSDATKIIEFRNGKFQLK